MSELKAAGSVPVRLLTIGDDDAGQRIDNFLLRVLKGVPRSRVYRILRRGEVRVNAARVRPTYRLASGDRVRVPPVRSTRAGAAPRPSAGLVERLERAVLFEDERLLIIDKPAGLAVHGGSGVSRGVIETLREMRPGASLELVHRLDRDTSGCLMVAKRRSTLRMLHALLREGGMEKRYLALLAGRLHAPEVTATAPLQVTRRGGGERFVVVDEQAGKAAHTEFRRVAATAEFTFADVRLGTGRTHQIRVHAAHLGHAVAGDERYGDSDANRRAREHGLNRLFLHANALRFRLPDEGRDFSVEAPLEAALIGVLDNLGLAASVESKG